MKRVMLTTGCVLAILLGLVGGEATAGGGGAPIKIYLTTCATDPIPLAMATVNVNIKHGATTIYNNTLTTNSSGMVVFDLSLIGVSNGDQAAVSITPFQGSLPQHHTLRYESGREDPWVVSDNGGQGCQPNPPFVCCSEPWDQDPTYVHYFFQSN